MQTITSTADLKKAIQLLEVEQKFNEKLLKEQFHQTCESLKPFSLLKSTLKDIVSAPFSGNNILGTAVGLASGYLSKKIVVRKSGNIFKKLLGSLLQLGVTNVVSHHPEAIKTYGKYVIQHLRRKKKSDSEKSVNIS